MSTIHIASISDLIAFGKGELGIGTSEDPLDVYLDRDLDFATENVGEYKEYDWPGCTAISEYCTFHGQSHTIDNIRYTGSSNWGFFPYATQLLNVEKLALTNMNILTTGSAGGIFCQWAQGITGTISYCKVTGVLASDGYTGGIAGYEPRDGYTDHAIRYCTFSGILKGSTVGGIMGFKHRGTTYNYSTTVIQNCGVRASIISSNYGCGIVASNGDTYYMNLIVQRSYFIGSFDGSSNTHHNVSNAIQNWSEIYTVIKSVKEGVSVNGRSGVLYDSDVASAGNITITDGVPETTEHLQSPTYLHDTLHWGA